MKRPISGQIVVITGASSGIGRACTIQFVNRGATVVAVARGRERLDELAASLASASGRVHVAPADVSVWEQVHGVARAVVERFGRIDTWVNNAAVTMYASAEESTVEEIAQVLDVNLMGLVHGVKAVLPVMRAQGGGTIINIGSVLSSRAVPLQAAYVASKHAVAGFTEALRMELEYEKAGIDVTLIQPSSINTPLFEHARSKLRVLPGPIPPVYQPEAVARAVLFAAERRRRDIVVGGGGAALIALQRISPRLVDLYMTSRGRFFRAQTTTSPDDGRDNLFAPLPGPGRVHGVFGEEAREGSPYTRVFEYFPAFKSLAAAVLLPLVAEPLAVLLAGVGLGALARQLRGPRDRRTGEAGESAV